MEGDSTEKVKTDESEWTKDKPFQEASLLLQKLEMSLKRGTYHRSHELATKTLQLVEKYVQSWSWKNASEVLNWLEMSSDRLTKAAVSESAPSNIIQRLIKIIREEFSARKKTRRVSGCSETSTAMTASRLDSVDSGVLDFTEEIPDLRSDILNAILDLSAELESSAENIAEDASQHIHHGANILTVGRSRTVEKFLLKAASEKTKFNVIIATCGPFYSGSEMAQTLQKASISTCVIEDTAVFSYMRRVDKVIIGTHTILANGGLKAISGCHPILLAANYYNVSVLVLAPLYKLSPEYPLSNNLKIKNRFVSPELFVKYEDLTLMEDVQIYAPVFDYVPPELITLFIFDIGSHSPSYIYRLLHDTYPQMD